MDAGSLVVQLFGLALVGFDLLIVGLGVTAVVDINISDWWPAEYGSNVECCRRSTGGDILSAKSILVRVVQDGMAELERVTVDDLRSVLAEVDKKRPAERLMAVINYVEEDDASMAEVAERYGYTGSWVSQWMHRLERLADEPFEAVVYDDHRSGRPTKLTEDQHELTEDQHEQFVQALNEPLEEAGLDAPVWSVPLAEQYLQEEFDVTFCRRHVRRLMTEVGLSWKTARPSYVDSDERAQEAFRDGFKKSSES